MVQIFRLIISKHVVCVLLTWAASGTPEPFCGPQNTWRGGTELCMQEAPKNLHVSCRPQTKGKDRETSAPSGCLCKKVISWGRNKSAGVWVACLAHN